jgi:hypothetical protein
MRELSAMTLYILIVWSLFYPERAGSLIARAVIAYDNSFPPPVCAPADDAQGMAIQ